MLAPDWRLAVNADVDKTGERGGDGEGGGERRRGEGRPGSGAVISIDLKSN